MTDFVIVLSTVPVDFDAGALARTLVSERLAACVNILPAMTSVYRWKDAVEGADERQLVIKTSQARAGALVRRMDELHPYDVPEILVLPVEDGASTYLEWLRASTTVLAD